MSWFTAPPSSQRRAFALSALAAALAAVPGHAFAQKRPPRVDDKNAPTVLRAEHIEGRPERELTLQREAVVTRDQTKLNADTACYKMVEDEVDASGKVRLWRFGDYYTGDLLKLNMETGRGFVLKPTYKIATSNGQGKAERVDFINPEEAVVVDGTYSTCEGENPDWYLKSSTLNLDTGRDVGTGGKTIVYFKNVPILGTPAISFSLSGARRSGWLAPTVGFASKNGLDLTMPYYVNIAPNRDLTLYPRYIQRRGLQLGANGRYIGETAAGSYAGETLIEYLPRDRLYKGDRYALTSSHLQALAPGLSYGWNVRTASDDDYPSDFSKTVASSAERQLLREIYSEYRGEYWNLTARAQNYQVLQDPTLFVPRPYDRLPSLNLHVGRFDVGGFDWAVDAELTRFWHPDQVRGNRAVVVPQLSYPFIRPGYFITPKLMLHASAYQLDDNVVSNSQFKDRAPTRAVPTVSVDSGLVFERDAKLFGRAVTQTLEPRLFFVYTPYREQSGLPLFDTADAGFTLAQLFSENRFVGADRIGDTKQVTAALTSRFLEPSGAERLRLTFGQRYYLTEQKVQLGATSPNTPSRSDMLLAAAGRISETWGFDSALQYNASDRRMISGNYSLQWQPGPKKVLNVGQRNYRGSFKNTEVSAQWPLSSRWYGVGRINYSVLDKRIIESLVGLEYKRDCWVFRMGAQRFVTTAKSVSTPIFFQLELIGLSSNLGFGSNALEVLSTKIPGYQRLSPATR
ncbi:LPS-assembly protein LptD [Janthinobacterium fluminis]|uniref:LPS-assembly protein LptD n=1 Tax=Janthinobacterium fluminis TaxID=2987524 RepID=A0ABT5K3D8_9BURK|nr:LPS-assembly protein LptD [Janthinobacterium fluminis]MDC8759485.1 LPS-assembly protein LptD [Janthinobacterium fluminis]